MFSLGVTEMLRLDRENSVKNGEKKNKNIAPDEIFISRLAR